MQVYQHAAGLQQVAGLAVVQANCFDMRLQPVQAQIQNRLRGIGDGKEFAGSFIDTHIGGLCAQQNSRE